jgi:hypothetical protein
VSNFDLKICTKWEQRNEMTRTLLNQINDKKKEEERLMISACREHSVALNDDKTAGIACC